MQPLNKPQQKNCEKIVDSEIQDSVKKRQPVCILIFETANFTTKAKLRLKGISSALNLFISPSPNFAAP